jgi:hypothetical protein
MSAKPSPRILAVLKLPEYEVPRLISIARAMVAAMGEHSSIFPVPEPPLSVVESAIDDLATAESLTRSRLVGTVAVRDAKRAVLVAQLGELRAYVQAQANASGDQAALVIEAAFMSVKRTRRLAAYVFAAKRGRVSGSVTLVAPQAGNRAGYEWAQSLDGGATWTSLEFTVKANLTVAGLTPGSRVHFRYRAVTKDGMGDWSQPVAIIVD